MLVPMKTLLDHANKHGYAVMAINSVTMESTKAIVAAAQAECAPVIVNVSPRQMHAHATGKLLAPMVRTLAGEAGIPVAFNLDHGGSYEDLAEAMGLGFSSVMIDASSCPYEENVSRTATIATLAHGMGISVEGELGHVGATKEGDNEKQDLYTDVAQARDYVERTGVDCLAVAIGTAHGSYPKGMTPHLDFDRLRELKETLGMPLVLHGGSGSGEDNIRRAVALGINKINVCTDVFAVARQALLDAITAKPTIDYMDLAMASQASMENYIRAYMRLIGSSGRFTYGGSTGPAFD